MPSPSTSTTDAQRSFEPADDPSPTLRALTPVDLARLQNITGYPMVSVLLPTTPAARLAAAESTALRHLIDQAERRLAVELPAREIAEAIGALRALAADITESPTGSGVALFCGAEVLEAYRLPLAPDARVVIDPTFATRDLARAVLDNPPYRLLTLAAGTARLYLGTGTDLHEQLTHGFPFDTTAARSTADRRGHLHQGERTHDDSRRWDWFIRQVDTAAASDRRGRDLPLILAAAEPLASRYRRLARHPIIGTVAGNHQRTTKARLADLARPVIDDHLARQRRAALDELEDAVNRRRVVVGINDVWRAAHDRQIVRLLVDPDYRYPALPAPDGRSLTPSADPEHPAVVDDAVDEIIEAVARHGGSTCFTPLPTEHGRLAAIVSTK